jgi:hypothetical protein
MSDDLEKLSHFNDPSTSKEAIKDLNNNGTRAKHMQKVLKGVKAFPLSTACELAKVLNMGEYQVRRRLSDLKNQDLVVHGPKRHCGVKLTKMVTWKALSEEEVELFRSNKGKTEPTVVELVERIEYLKKELAFACKQLKEKQKGCQDEVN